VAGGGDFDDEGEITGINVTPLVDITLVLLIIFMVTTSVITDAEGMRVAKPEAASGNKLEHDSVLLVCHEDGSVLVDREVLADDDAIVERIASKVAEDPEVQGIVQCDTKAEVGSMVHLIDLLRLAGVKKYAIATKQPEPAAG
jgi:biopolymer transport protein ExbD